MIRRRQLTGLLATMVAVIVSGSGVRAERPAALAPLTFLLGEWEGAGDQAGTTGGFTFKSTVQDHVIVRTNFSITPAADGKPASRHDDVMLIYVEGTAVKADYVDNEGHVIRYAAQARDGEVRFVSEARPSEPRYRLTYTSRPGNTIAGTFEVAPPDKPEGFVLYLSWTARRAKAG